MDLPQFNMQYSRVLDSLHANAFLLNNSHPLSTSVPQCCVWHCCMLCFLGFPAAMYISVQASIYVIDASLSRHLWGKT
jgi:hypothetical protein